MLISIVHGTYGLVVTLPLRVSTTYFVVKSDQSPPNVPRRVVTTRTGCHDAAMGDKNPPFFKTP